LEGRKFPVQDSSDLTHKNFIYHRRIFGPCPEDDSSDRDKVLFQPFGETWLWFSSRISNRSKEVCLGRN